MIKQTGGNKYIKMANSMYYENKYSRSDILAKVLSQIMTDLKINPNTYMIIASYCLKDIRDVSDLDVIMTKESYEMLKKNKIGTVSEAKISKDERIVITFPFGDNVEIEFFPKDINQGFPSENYSIKSLMEKKQLIKDAFGKRSLKLLQAL
jgi:hypothetical protein